MTGNQMIALVASVITIASLAWAIVYGGANDPFA